MQRYSTFCSAGVRRISKLTRLVLLLTSSSHSTRRRRSHNILELTRLEKEKKRMLVKRAIGYPLLTCYFGLCFYVMLVIGANLTKKEGSTVIISYVVAITQQIVVNQVLRVFIQMLFVMHLGKNRQSKMRNCIMKILDQQMISSFG